jgi:hypothetical protein
MGRDMTKIRLEFVQAFIDRHGRVRHYFRRRGFKRIPLPGRPGSEEFMAAYRQALGADAPRIEIAASRTIGGTVNSVVAAYLDGSPQSTSPFKTLAKETQRTRRHILERFREKHGDKRVFRLERGKRVMLLTREHMQKMSMRRLRPHSRNAIFSIRCVPCFSGLWVRGGCRMTPHWASSA